MATMKQAQEAYDAQEHPNYYDDENYCEECDGEGCEECENINEPDYEPDEQDWDDSVNDYIMEGY